MSFFRRTWLSIKKFSARVFSRWTKENELIEYFEAFEEIDWRVKGTLTMIQGALIAMDSDKAYQFLDAFWAELGQANHSFRDDLLPDFVELEISTDELLVALSSGIKFLVNELEDDGGYWSDSIIPLLYFALDFLRA